MCCLTRMRLTVTIAITAAIAAVQTTRAAGPIIEKINLFTSNKDGYALYRIPGIIVTKAGSVLAYCEARRTGTSDWDTIDLYLRRSTDGGRSWSERRRIADVTGPKTRNPVAIERKQANADDVTYNNPVAIADENGSVHFLFCLEYARCFYLRSDNDGETWSQPLEITNTFQAFRREYNWRVLATGPGHGIQLRNGRLIVPVWLSLGTAGNGHSPSVSSVIFSDDHGLNWRRGDIAVPNTPATLNPSETVAVELSDGHVMLNVRNHAPQHRRLVTTSSDGATGWTRPRLDDALVEPVCMASLVRFPWRAADHRSRLVFANPHNLERADGAAKPGGSRDRKNLSIRFSDDDGRTWSVPQPLEPGNSAYSDLAVLPDRTVLCFYERGGETDDDPRTRATYAYLTLARFKLD